MDLHRSSSTPTVVELVLEVTWICEVTLVTYRRQPTPRRPPPLTPRQPLTSQCAKPRPVAAVPPHTAVESHDQQDLAQHPGNKPSAHPEQPKTFHSTLLEADRKTPEADHRPSETDIGFPEADRKLSEFDQKLRSTRGKILLDENCNDVTGSVFLVPAESLSPAVNLLNAKDFIPDDIPEASHCLTASLETLVLSSPHTILQQPETSADQFLPSDFTTKDQSLLIKSETTNQELQSNFKTEDQFPQLSFKTKDQPLPPEFKTSDKQLSTDFPPAFHDPCECHRPWVRQVGVKCQARVTSFLAYVTEMEGCNGDQCGEGQGCHEAQECINNKGGSREGSPKKEKTITECLDEFLAGLHLSHLGDYLRVLGCTCVRDLRLLEKPELDAIQLISRRRLLQELDTLVLHHEAPPADCSLEGWLTWYGLAHISGFLNAIGVHSVTDMTYLREDDLLLLKPVTRRRILACHRKE